MGKLLFTLAVCMGAHAAFAQHAGDLDSTFGTNGITILPGSSSAYGLALQSDGKIVTTGDANGNFAVMRFTAAGSLDAAFGTDGIDTIAAISGHSVLIQPDGKIVAGGQVQTDSGLNYFIARFSANGALDNSFGTAGINSRHEHGNDIINALVLQPDGKIVACGDPYSLFNGDMLRYNTDGTIDTNFGNKGIVAVSDTASGLANTLSKVLLQPGGALLAVGGVDLSFTSDFGLYRYDNNGHADPGFGINGIVTTDLADADISDNTAVLLPDGSIIAIGETDGNGTDIDFQLIKYHNNGNIDSTYGSDSTGRVSTDVFPYGGDDIAQAAVLQSSGKIIVAGTSVFAQSQFISIVRYMPNGSLDTSFGVKGTVSTVIPGMRASINDMQLQDSSIIVTGTGVDNNNVPHMFVARYNANGLYAAVHDVKDIQFSIYPDPSQGTFTIQAGSLTNGRLSISNMLGQVIYQAALNAGRTNISLDVPAGIYIVAVSGSNGAKSMQRLVISGK